MSGFSVTGGPGGDTFFGGPGNDTFIGGAGIDLVFLGDVGFRNSGRSVSGGTVTITSRAGTDQFAGVEEIVFADGTLVFNPADPAAQVVRLYQAALDRSPDQTGLNNWSTALLEQGRPLSAVAQGFLNAPEFQARFGSLPDNGAFVDRLYINVLDRPADPGGRAFWVNTLNAGASRAEVLTGFSESIENRALTAPVVDAGIWDRSEVAAQVARLYDTVLGRLPDVPGLNASKTAIQYEQLTLAQVADRFTNSIEFRSAYGVPNNQQFVEILYQNALDRPGTGAEIQNWTNFFDAGAPRSSVVLGISESAEHVALTSANIQSENPAQFGILFG